MKIVLASNNRGKLAELQAMLASLGVELVRRSTRSVALTELGRAYAARCAAVSWLVVMRRRVSGRSSRARRESPMSALANA